MRRLAGGGLGVGAALFLAAVASAALASTRSQQLYAKALVAVSAQRWETAQVLLDEAALADPGDAAVAYYRGLVNARLGEPEAAIKEMERALAARPDLQPAVLDLGILFFQTDRYESAEVWLRRAMDQPVNRFPAALFLGLVRLRLDDARGAAPFFAEAGKDPALRMTAQYYQAVALTRAGEPEQARALLAQVQAGPVDGESTQIARQYLAATADAGDERPWTVHGEAGFGYDSNVVLAPNDVTLSPGRTILNCYTTVNGICVPLDTKGKDDGFFEVAAGGSYRLFATESGRGTLGYNFYQSVHFQTSSFDLQNQEIYLNLVTPLGRWGQTGVSGFYDFYMLDYQSFYNQGRVVPWVTLFEGEMTATQVYYQFVSQDYARAPFSPFRDAFNNAVGFQQLVLLGASDRVLRLGYQWDYNNPLSSDGTDFAYADSIISAQIDFPLLDWAHGTAGYAVDLQNYKDKNSRTDRTLRRHDVNNQAVVRLVRDLTPYLSVELAYFGVYNISNIPDFAYDRSIGEIGLRLHF